MKKITFLTILIIALISVNFQLNAQVKHTVSASGMSFTPSTLLINQGDTVEWNNVSGFHNVNGTQATFPSNPVSFGNGAAGAPWTYSFVFNSIGNYAYMCDVHGINMSGTITVQTPLKVTEVDIKKNINIFPNPITNSFTINLNQAITSVSVYSITGELVKTFYQTTKFDVTGLPKGVYILNIETGDKIIVEKIVIQ